uniref:Transmembrane protein n=1 Tax=Romanomermis culicivorax TaxID=13658 RepID=A0A915K3S1_ROMCU
MFAVYRNLYRPSKCVPLINVSKRTILPRRINGRDFTRIKEDQAQRFAKKDRLKTEDWTLIYYSKKHYSNIKLIYGMFVCSLIPTFIAFVYHTYNKSPHLALLKKILDWPKILAIISMTCPFPFLLYYYWRNFVLRIYRHNRQPRKYAFVDVNCFLMPNRPKIVMRERIIHVDFVQRNMFLQWRDGNFLVNGSKKMIWEAFFNRNSEFGELQHF